MINELLFLLHSISVVVGALIALRLGKQALIGFLCLQGILANLFVTKQIALFSFHATASDVFAVGCIFSLNLLQEFFGQGAAKKAIGINLFLTLFYLCMTQFHLGYTPSPFDIMQPHYQAILSFMPRIIIASVVTFFTVQLSDTYVYQTLHRLFTGKYLVIRSFASLTFSQFLDTIMFSFLGLYGIVHAVWDLIIVSFAIKMTTILLVALCLSLTKQYLRKNYEHKL